jgi:hypothetical protein
MVAAAVGTRIALPTEQTKTTTNRQDSLPLPEHARLGPRRGEAPAAQHFEITLVQRMNGGCGSQARWRFS